MAAGGNISPDVADKLVEERIMSTKNVIIFDKNRSTSSRVDVQKIRMEISILGLIMRRCYALWILPCIVVIWRYIMRLLRRLTLPWRRQGHRIKINC